MPDPWAPDCEKYKAEFKKYEVEENDILVGHSCGSAFLVRWLGETKKRINKLILKKAQNKQQFRAFLF